MAKHILVLAVCAALKMAVGTAWAQEVELFPHVEILGAAFGPAGFMGVNLADINSDRAKALKLRDVYGVEITRVEENSPAAKAGIKTGDVVLEYNGQRVEGMEQFGRLVRETPPGREAKLLVSRDGNVQTINVTVGARSNDVYATTIPNFTMPEIRIPEIHIPDMPRVYTNLRSGMLGVETQSLGSQLAEFFGVKEGVLVRSVIKGSAAEKAGMKAGDVILRVDNETVATPNELSSALRAARAKTTVPIQIMRDHHEMTLTVTLERGNSGRLVVPRARAIAVRNARI